jgi:hypothetical protein
MHKKRLVCTGNSVSVGSVGVEGHEYSPVGVTSIPHPNSELSVLI